VRFVAALVVVLVLAGCGSSSKHSATSSLDRRLLLPKPQSTGRWTKLVLSPDGGTYLGQWSGECEIRTAYLISAHGSEARPLTDYARGSAQSIAVGWAGTSARVRLPQGQPPERKPGVYLVDPKTLAMTLERPLPRRRGC
jgi:hypothetical protein